MKNDPPIRKAAQVSAPSLSLWRYLLNSQSLQETISGHHNNYTVIRFFLAASVIYFHSFALLPGPAHVDVIGQMLAPVATLGGLAVQVFFFLSGLFVSQSYAKNPNVIHFLIKRFFRIWPGLFTCLVVAAAVSCLFSGTTKMADFLRFSEFYDYIVQNSLFRLTWDIAGVFDGRKWSSLNGSIHTLPLEVKMYAVLALFACVRLLSTQKLMVIAAAIVLAIAAIPSGHFALLDEFFAADYARGAVAMFFLGVIAFACSRWIYVAAWQFVIVVALVAVTKDALHVAAFYLAVIWVTLFLGQSMSLGRIIRPRADLSYGVYIYGWPCQQLVISAFGVLTNLYLFAAISLIAASACAAVSWKFIEKPSITLGHRLAYIELPLKRKLPARLVPTSYETRLGATLVVLFVSCVLMLWASRSFDIVPVTRMSVDITDFGPKEGKVGVPFNAQPDGSSAFWLKYIGHPDVHTLIVFDGHTLVTQLGAETGTALVKNTLLAQPGDKPIFLERRIAGETQRSNVVTMHIGH